MISDKLFSGHGLNSFQSNYMHYQADYFSKHPTDPYRHLAGNNIYAFNELLRLTSEQGLIGLLLITILIIIYFRSFRKSKNSLVLISQAGIILILVFGMFSYPTEILQLKLAGVLFIAIISKSSKSIISVSPSGFSNAKRIILFALILFSSLFGASKIYKTSEIYKSWNIAISEFKKGDFNGFIHFGKSNYTTLKSNGYFLGYYGKSLFANQQYTEALAIFEPTLFLIPSTEVYVDIGKCYEKLGNFEKAELFWTKAANMVPAQFKPKYLIAKMYFENGQVEKAKKIASDLLINQKIKVYSIEVHEILEALKKILE